MAIRIVARYLFEDIKNIQLEVAEWFPCFLLDPELDLIMKYTFL